MRASCPALFWQNRPLGQMCADFCGPESGLEHLSGCARWPSRSLSKAIVERFRTAKAVVSKAWLRSGLSSGAGGSARQGRVAIESGFE